MSDESEEKQDKHPDLKECSLCGSDLSPYSPFCRHCGHPQGSMLALWILVAITILFIAGYVGMMLFCMHNVQDYRVYEDPPAEIQEEQDNSTRDMNSGQ